MKKSNYSFFILQLLFAAAISSALIMSACSRTNTGTDPSPPGGEIVFVYDVETYIEGAGADVNSPLWWDEGSTLVGVHVSFKANPTQPVSGIPVDFMISGGGNFYSYEEKKNVGTVATVYTNDSGNALLWFSTVKKTIKRTTTNFDPAKGWVTVENDYPDYNDQTVTACVDEPNIGNLYDNCRSSTIFINGPPKDLPL